MTQDRAARRENALPHSALPVQARAGRVDLPDDHVHHSVEQFVFVSDVFVERHRHDAELLSEPAHAHRGDAGLVGEPDRGLQHPFPVQALATAGLRVCDQGHLRVALRAP